jgi:hypothetical protein
VRAALLACLGWLALAGSAAADLRLERGVNLDIWVNWLTVDEMLADPEFLAVYPDWRRHYTAGTLDRLRAAGFDHVRLPLDPAPLLALGPGPARDRLIAEARETVEEVLAAGLAVVVDLHSIPRPEETWGTGDVVARLWPEHLALVGRVAAALDGLPPDRVAFEPLNEPTLDCPGEGDGPPRWPGMLAELHAAARGGAPELPLVLSGACWGGIDGLEAIDPAAIGDDNVIWSFHSYEPFEYTHQSAVWTYAPLRYIDGLPYPPSELGQEAAQASAARAGARAAAAGEAVAPEAIAAEIARYAATSDGVVAGAPLRAAAWADRHGIARARLYLGEFGALRAGADGRFPPGWQHRFLSDKRRAAEALGIGWAVWNLAGDMGVTLWDDPDRRVDPDACSALGLPGC